MTDYAELPDPRTCTSCGQTFRPGGSWRSRYGDVCADCTPPRPRRKPRIITSHRTEPDDHPDQA